MTFTITQEHSFPAPTDRVFEALISPTELTKWFAEHVDVSAVDGGNYRFWGRHTLGNPSGEDARQKITQIERDRALSFAWLLNGVPTDVDLHLQSRDAGSRLLLAHSVCGDIGEPRAHSLIDDHWRLAFANLTAHLADGTGMMLPDYAGDPPVIRHTVEIDAPPAVVFRAMTEPTRINRWFGNASATVEPHVGGKYDLAWHYKVDGRDVAGGPRKILELVDGERLVLDWPDWRGDTEVPDQSIAFELEPNGLGGTSLTFTHTGFTRAADVGDFCFGWLQFLHQLRNEATN